MDPIDQLAADFGTTAQRNGDEATFRAQVDGVDWTVWYRGGRYPQLRVQTPTSGPVPAARVTESPLGRRSWFADDDDLVRVGDRAFDTQAAVNSRCRPAVVRRAFEPRAVREGALAAIDAGFQRVDLGAEVLSAFRSQVPPGLLEPARLRDVLTALTAARAALPGFAPDEVAPRPPPPKWLERVAEWVVFGVPVLEFVAVTAAASWWPPARRAPLAELLLAGVALGLITLPLVRPMFRALGTGMGPLPRASVWLAVVACLAMFAGLAINGAVDRSATRTHTAQVLDRSYGRGIHWLQVRAWDEPGATMWVPAPHRVWHRLRNGAWIDVLTRGGRLGIEWVVDVRAR